MLARPDPGVYRGRFAPSPTGPLHAGSLVAALASWLDARAHGGRWLIRLEDVDVPRCPPGMGEVIVEQLARCGLRSDEPVWWQSRRSPAYQGALARLVDQGQVYPCACSRADIERSLEAAGQGRTRHGERVYPGTCRPERGGLQGRPARAWRLRVPDDERGRVHWEDGRWLGARGPSSQLAQQHVGQEVGDFVLKRADGLWAYQLAVVVDDAEQGITHVVRGLDLVDNTPRQIWLQRALGLPTPTYLHTPLVLAADGQKLSKQNGAKALDLADPLHALRQAGAVLGLPVQAAAMAAPRTLTDWLSAATRAWWSLRTGDGRHPQDPR